MREFLDESNLARAAMVSAGTTLAALPRILQAGTAPVLLGVALFILTLFVAGAATAWGTKGDLRGLFPVWSNLAPALLFSAACALVLIPLFLFVFDPHMTQRLAEAGANDLLARSFPEQAGEILALALWAAGFETLFFLAGTMSTVARLSGQAWTAVVCAVLLRLFISSRQFMEAGLDAGDFALYTAPLLAGTAASLLYARGGWPAAGLFALLMAGRHFFH